MKPSSIKRRPAALWRAMRPASVARPDWAGAPAEALDMALSAHAFGVSDPDIEAAFGPEAARLAGMAGAFAGCSPALPTPDRRFTTALEARLADALDRREGAPIRSRPPRPSLGLLSALPGRPELAFAAAAAILLGVTAVRDGWSASPALAVTPTTAVRETGTPYGPTRTATFRSPSAGATAQPVAMAGDAPPSTDGAFEW